MAALPMILIVASCLILCVGGRSLLQSTGDALRPLCSRACDPEVDSRHSTYPKYHCSCGRSCAAFGDCCYDSTHKNTMSSSQFDFVCLPVADRGQYQAVSSCPQNRNHDACRQSLGLQPPVTSRTTNITYANVFCASCNGDGDNVLTWSVHLRCPTERDSRGRRTRKIYDLDDFRGLSEEEKSATLCKFQAPSGLGFLDDLELRSCISSAKVSACSVTWHDLSVVEKCRSYEDPIFVEDTLYRNRHCAECNYRLLDNADCIPFSVKRKLQDGSVSLSTIVHCMTTSPGRCNFDDYKGDDYTLSNILNVNQAGCVPPEGRRCCAGERFHFPTSRCRKTSSG